MATLNELLTSRVPPHSIEAERAVLGAMLLEQDAAPKVFERLVSDDFYKESHRKIFSAMTALFERSVPLDLVVLHEELSSQGAMADIGGPAMLAGLLDEAGTSAMLPSYAEIVLEKAVLRQVIRVGSEAVGNAYEVSNGATISKEILENTQRKLFALTERQVVQKAVPMGQSLRETFEYVEALYDRKISVNGVATGFDGLDQLTNGFQPSDFIVIAARPSQGKTAFMLNIARNAGDDKVVLILSLEMARGQLIQRMLCAEARVDLSKLRSGFLLPTDWTRLTSAAGRLMEKKIYIDDAASMTIMDLRAKLKRFKYENGLDMVFVDYLQLIRGGRRENRQQEVAEVSRMLKAAAKEFEIPVVGISQLSRAVESRERKEPVLSDLRESGQLEQDADVVLFLYRPGVYGFSEDKLDSQVIIGKQRNGPIGRVPLQFVPEYASFERVSNRPDPF